MHSARKSQAPKTPSLTLEEQQAFKAIDHMVEKAIERLQPMNPNLLFEISKEDEAQMAAALRNILD